MNVSLETMILCAQAASVFFLAAWLTTGVWENLFYSEINSTFTAEGLHYRLEAPIAKLEPSRPIAPDAPTASVNGQVKIAAGPTPSAA